MGAGIEFGIGFGRMVFLYVLSGLGGITLSMCVRPNAHGVGASTAVFGLVGFFLTYIFSNFGYMGRERSGQRIFLIIYCSLLILMNLNIGPNADGHVDNWGHLGGCITGVLCGYALTNQYDADARAAERAPDRFTEEQYKNKSGCCKSLPINRLGQILLFIWFAGLFIYFYFIMDISFEDEDED